MPILQSFGPANGAAASFRPHSSRSCRRPRATTACCRCPRSNGTPQVERETAHLYERVKTVVPPVEWPFFAPYVKAINALKKERNAVILAHNYQTPEIYNCVADFVGDSLQLAREATKVDADIIVQCGVHFMAETSKILNPDKTVLIPDRKAGCSLASSITGDDVRLLRERFPGVPVVAYVNTSADVKAEVDICCTSSNAVQVVESLGADTVIFLPDQYLAKYVAVADQSEDHCLEGRLRGARALHRRRAASLSRGTIRRCRSSRIRNARPTSSPRRTTPARPRGMIDWVRKHRPRRVVMVTECSMADNVQAELPDVEFVRPCNLCPHMKRITLPKILDSLVYLKEEVVIDPAIAEKARRSVERMVNLRR